MPIFYLRRLTGKERTAASNRHLGYSLAFIAGAINAGGFFAVGQYTSHMTGIVSAMTDDLALGHIGLVLDGLGALLSFICGAAVSAILINWARHRNMQSEYAFPLMLEAGLLLCFGLMGGTLSLRTGLFVPVTVMLLCFIMGLQNAIITKLSHAEIRTTHVTGLVTDIGIELGKKLYWNKTHHIGDKLHVKSNLPKLRLLGTLLLMFFSGGVTGALGFKHVGFISTVPLALLLMLLALVPVLDDMKSIARRYWVR
ncbi:MAG: YoaK family protein [Oxalobacteraceae bacterium]|nr:YoaK family protein [Oxalobacteraceae bacterium]